VDIFIEVPISVGNEDAKVSIEVTSVVSLGSLDICTTVAGLIELIIVSETICDIVDSSDCAIELLMNVDSLGSVVEISGEVDLVISFSSVDVNTFSIASEVVVMALIELVDVDVIVRMFDTSSDDMSNEDLVSVITEGVIDVVNKLLFSAVLDNSILVCSVIRFVLVSKPLLVIGSLSVVTLSVFDTMDDNVNGLLAFSVVVIV
jgi:hypothetical protein